MEKKENKQQQQQQQKKIHQGVINLLRRITTVNAVSGQYSEENVK